MHELGIEARELLAEPFELEGQAGGIVIAVKRGAASGSPTVTR